MVTQTLTRRLAHFQPIHDVSTFLAMAAWIALLPLLQRCLSLPKLLALLTPQAGSKPTDPVAPFKLQRHVDRLLRTRIGPYQPNCLKRSLVLYRFLRKAGYEVTLCLGVQKADACPTADTTGSFSGHAWLTQSGEPFLESNPAGLERFAVTFRYPEAKSTAVQQPE